jgi:hypothetical protein
MNKAPVMHARFFAGLFFLATICTGLSVLRAWLPFREWGTSFFGWLVCCNMQSGSKTPMLPDDSRLTAIAFGVFAIGIGMLFLRVIQTHSQIGRLLEHAPVQPPHKLAPILVELNLIQQVFVVQSAEPFAFCYGFFQPRICLSSGLVELLSPHQLEAVLLHEDHHRRKYHPLRILFIEALSNMLFFLPVVREWGEISKVRLELAADGYAISKAGKPALAGALHRLLRGGGAPSPVMAGAAIAGLTTNAVRIAALLEERTSPLLISPRSFLQSSFGLGALCLLLML